MSAPTAPNCVAELLERLETCDALDRDRFHQFLEQQPPSSDDPLELLNRLVAAGVLTAYHKRNILLGRFQGYCLGPYRMLDHLGTGGMGKVYLAEHLELQRRVAIKVLPKKMIDEPGSRERFSREARAAAALDHPNLVRVYDVETSGRIPFIVMEYIEGESLAERVIRLGPLPVSDLVNYAIQTASGLQHAHERGLIHRDIKPANLLLDRHGVLKILDMGLARFNDERADQLTAKLDPDSVLGTPDYLSPEQAINSNTVDIRSDLYSLGATLYHLASGRVPFRGSTAQKLMQVQLRNPGPVREDSARHATTLGESSELPVGKGPEPSAEDPASGP